MTWQTKKLGEICDILDNKRKPITKRNRTTGEYPYYGATGILDYVDDYIFNEKLVLIGEDGAKWGSGEHTAFIADGKYWVNNHAHVIRPHRNIILDNWIVFYFYLTDLTKHTTGLTVPKLNQANLRNIEIPLPPLPEQRHIVKILDEFFADVAKAKETAEKNLQNAKDLFESYLQSVFAPPSLKLRTGKESSGKDWEEKRLGEVCDFFNGKAHEKVIDKNGEYVVVNSKFISSEGQKFKKTKKMLFPMVKGDIAMVMSDVPKGKTLAKCFLVDKDNTYTLNQRICIFRSNKFDKKFLFYQLNRNKYFLSFDNKENQSNLRKNDILNCPIFIPAITAQKSVVTKLDALSAETKKLETIYQQKLANLEELKKSVLKRAFNGDL